ncbi:hypothetical protein Btru_027099 [Bulinus truncatus]|nr:hypothetical protein Btru_027099 [Bulinus truncatus]
MWLQMTLAASVLAAVRGMCFGEPLLQPPVNCPEPMIYYAQLCICLEPKSLDRLNEIVSIRQVPMMTTNYMDPTEIFKSKLDALRHRLTASLPDTGYHGYGSAIGDVRIPLAIFADRYLVPTTSLANMFGPSYNRIPRSWRIGGLLESWTNEALANGEIPAVSNNGPFNTATSGWAPAVNDISTLSLMERLHNLRTAWRDASQSAQDNRLTESAIANDFFKHLPVTGISPDTARNFFSAAGVPDSPQPQKVWTRPQLAVPVTSQKQPQLVQNVMGALSKDPMRRNSYLRGQRISISA